MRHICTVPTRIRRLVVGSLAAVLLTACGGDSEEDAIFFELDTAAETVRAAMVEPSDLPGLGWEVKARDDFSDDNGFDFEPLLHTEPNCEELADLFKLANFMGSSSDGDDSSIAVTKIELERRSIPIASTFQVELEVEESSRKVQNDWVLMQALMAAPDTLDCFVHIFNTAFKDLEAQQGVKVTVKGLEAGPEAPRDHARLSFDVSYTAQNLRFETVMHMYWWPYGNAQVSVLTMGPTVEMTDDFVSRILSAVDAKIMAAEANQ